MPCLAPHEAGWLAVKEPERSLRPLAAAARWTAMRVRAAAGLSRCAALCPAWLLYVALVLAWIKLTDPREILVTAALWGAVGLGFGCLASALREVLRARPATLGSATLDRYHGLESRVTSALEFASLPAAQRTPLMGLAIEDALARASVLSPRRAAPLHWPRETALIALLTLGVVGLGSLEVRSLRSVATPAGFEAVALPGDDLDLFRREARSLTERLDRPEALAAAKRFNALMEDLAQRRLDRRELFRRLEGLERELDQGLDANRAALEEGLDGLARELERAPLSRPIAEKLAQRNLPDAEKALEELAAKLKDKRRAPSKDDLDRLRRALERASQVSAERGKALAEERKAHEERRKNLLKKKQNEGLSPKEQAELDRTERQLERLDRERRKNDAAQKRTSELDRELARAAQELAKEMGRGAEDLRQAAEQVRRLQEQELTEDQKRQILEKLRELREVLRQQGQGGSEREQRMRRFAERARGEREKSGQGKPGSGQGSNSGNEKPGKSGKTPGELELSFGRGDGGPSLDGAGQGKPGGQGEGDADGDGPGTGPEPGRGHDPNVSGDPTRLRGQLNDVSAAAVDTGQGSASSEVIAGAAQRGFVGRGYRDVYREYQNVAEQALGEEEIPPGHRFYVKRYFQLIRPRE
jgi:hypothetical protein